MLLKKQIILCLFQHIAEFDLFLHFKKIFYQCVFVYLIFYYNIDILEYI